MADDLDSDSDDNNEPPSEIVEVDQAAIGDLPPEEVLSPDGKETTIYLEGEDPPSSAGWFDNLAEFLPEDKLSDLAEKYLELIERDMEDREKRDTIQADAIKKSGIGEPAPGGADFEGSSRVTHPVLVQSYIDFSASSIKELLPPNGPVKMKVEGKPNKKKMDRAKRKAAYMNWQCTRQIMSYRAELERLLTQLPAGGSQYAKVYWDFDRKRPDFEFVPIDDMILPYNARNFFTTPRKFHKMNLDELDYQRKVQSGVYLDLSLPSSYGNALEKTKSEKATDKIQGKRDDYTGENDERLIYEGYIYEDISDPKAPEGVMVPYIITIDFSTRQVLALYRDWDEFDDTYEAIPHIVDFTFIPWRGIFGLTLLQCLAGLPDALTGALRALMDAALISNLQGGIKLKGNPNGSSLSISPTQVAEVDAMGSDDIRKVFMPVPFNPPSPMLFQLLGFLTEKAQEVVGTAEEKIADASNNMPVGTTLALIEQGAKVFSSIHARLQDSQRRVLEIIHRLNRDHLPDGEKIMYGTDQDDYVTREDFEGSMDVHPVSDPNIFSETQRFAQVQFVIQTIMSCGTGLPQALPLFNIHAAFKRAFELAKIPDFEEILPPIPEAQPLNPATENIMLMLGKPVKAYAGQNHEAHIQVLMDFAKNPLLGANPIMKAKFLPGALNHAMDHIMVWYEETMKFDAALAIGKSVNDIDWDDDPESSVMLAKSAPIVDQASQLAFGALPPIFAQAIQEIQAMQPKPPMDPMVQVAMQDMQNKHEVAQGNLTLKQQKDQNDAQMKANILQEKAQAAAQDYQLELQKEGIRAQSDINSAIIQSQSEIDRAHIDTDSAKQIAAMKIAGDAATKLKDGSSLTKEND